MMKELFLALFFSKIVLLTEQPIDLVGTTELKLGSPVSAISSGASIEIEISQLLDEKIVRDIDIRSIGLAVSEMFPSGAVRAELIHSEGTTSLTHTGGEIVAEGSVRLRLHGVVPLSTEFGSISIMTNAPIPQALVYWKNYRK